MIILHTLAYALIAYATAYTLRKFLLPKSTSLLFGVLWFITIPAVFVFLIVVAIVESTEWLSEKIL